MQTQVQVESYVFNYTDAQGINYVLIKPSELDPNLDWHGTGFGLSSQCTAIPRRACTLSEPSKTKLGGFASRQNFTCELPDGKNVSGQTSTYTHTTWFRDWHKYKEEPAPFGDLYPAEPFDPRADNATSEDAETMFRNPWHWISELVINHGDTANTPEAILNSSAAFYFPASDLLRYYLSCNTTGKFLSQHE